MSVAQEQFNWKQIFWDNKILAWDFSRYERGGFFGKSGSVAARLTEAIRLLEGSVRGKTVLELGCGSGRLGEAVLNAGASHYVGCDLSHQAIARARSRLEAAGFGSRIELITGSALGLPEMKADVCVSLGFLDWLDPAEMNQLFPRLDCPYHLHSFSELRSFSVEQLLHRLYVFLSYARKTGPYRPRYLSERVVRELYRTSSDRPVRFLRNRRLTFGVLAHNLDTY